MKGAPTREIIIPFQQPPAMPGAIEVRAAEPWIFQKDLEGRKLLLCRSLVDFSSIWPGAQAGCDVLVDIDKNR